MENDSDLDSKEDFSPLIWPAQQVLPSFPPPAPTVDLFSLHSKSLRMEAEGEDLSHGTGQKQEDGWLASKDTDKPGHMIFGPYKDSLPVGKSKAVFSIKQIGQAAPEDVVAVLDVVDVTAKKTLGELKVPSSSFDKEGAYKNFEIEYVNSSYKNKIETRVYFTGKASIQVDWISLNRNRSQEEMILFASLKGLVNRKQPRLFSYEGDAYAEGDTTWLNSLKIKYNKISEKWDLLAKYKSEIRGLIVYDPNIVATINLATTLANKNRSLVASPALAKILSAAPYNLPVIEDLQGRFKDGLETYTYMYEKVWPQLSHRLLVGINPDAHLSAVREYAVGVGSATVWLNPKNADESKILNLFLSGLEDGAPYLGWWPSEEPGIIFASERNVPTIAADWSTNLTFHSSFPREIKKPAEPAKLSLKNKIYVAFILSDGDNLQYIEHLMRKLWNNPDRGKVPIGWSISPITLDAMPGALNYYRETATPLDGFVSGPSGYGYIFPNYWPDKDRLRNFVTKTEDYMSKTGLKVITVWNTVKGKINEDTGLIYAKNAPSLLGVTSQNTGGGLTVFNSELPSLALSCNYCYNADTMLEHIKRYSKDWPGNEPRFLMIQAAPWNNVTPSTFLKVKTSLDSSQYEFVLPDQLFELLREKQGIAQKAR